MSKLLIAYTEGLMKLLNKAEAEQLKQTKKTSAKSQELLEKTQELKDNINLLDEIS